MTYNSKCLSLLTPIVTVLMFLKRPEKLLGNNLLIY